MSVSREELGQSISELRGRFSSRGIRRVKVGGFDIDGVLRGKLISLDKFWGAVEKGFGFCDVIFGWDIEDDLYDNVAVTGWAQGYPDTLAIIDRRTLRMPSFESDTAHFLVDFYTQDRKPHPACPRGLLKRVAARAEAAGFEPRFAAEYEFWLFKESTEDLHQKSFRGLKPLSPGMFGYSWLREGQHRELAHRIMDTMDSYGIPIEGLHTETGPGVWEVAIHHAPVLEAADKAALFKTTLKQICAERGLSVTFMAKWNAHLPGSGGHVHQSLWDSEGKKNLFADDKAPAGLSKLARNYLGGQLALMRELSSLYAPFINSYKRYVPGVWAPMTASWGEENRTCAVRVIRGDSSSATRLEHRQPGADMNPYLAMAAMLGSGLHGIECATELPEKVIGDGGSQGDRLPRSLHSAKLLLESSEAARTILGENFVDHYARTRDWEVRQFQKNVSEWELARYFEIV